MTIGVGVVGWLGLGAVLTALPRPEATGEEIVGEIVVDADRVSPVELITTPECRVVFVNRSGHPIQIDFTTGKQELPHLGPVPAQTWIVFHQPGRYRYAVHFDQPGVPDLSGAVEVVPAPSGRRDPPTCSGIDVRGVCLQP